MISRLKPVWKKVPVSALIAVTLIAYAGIEHGENSAALIALFFACLYVNGVALSGLCNRSARLAEKAAVIAGVIVGNGALTILSNADLVILVAAWLPGITMLAIMLFKRWQ